MSVLKNVVQVTILGQNYAIKSDVSSEKVEEVAAFVNGRIREVLCGGHTVDSLQAMVLAFLNVASEYLQLQENHKHCEAEVARLLTRIEAVR